MNNSSNQLPVSVAADGDSLHNGSASAKPLITCIIRAYAELNDSLPQAVRYRPFEQVYPKGETIGGILLGLGLAPGGIDLVLVNGNSADCSTQVAEGDRISLYPEFESFDITSLTRLRSKPLRTVRFVLDVHLGKLAYYLRMLGFDTIYRNDLRDEHLVQICVQERRTLLSKDRALLLDERVQRYHRVRGTHPREQLVEVLRRFDLFDSCTPLERCMRCNVKIEPAEKVAILHLLPPRVVDAFHEFRQCPMCRRVYWEGSHYVRMMEFIRGVLNER